MPLVLNGDAGNQPGMVSTFFGRVAKHFANEMAVVTPNGALLAHDPEEGLRKWRALPAEQRRVLADLGEFDASFLPASPPDGLILDVFARALRRDEQGQLQIYKTEVARSLEAGRDHLWITKAEARALVPAQAEVGSRQAVAIPVVDRFCRRYLIDLVRVGGNGGPRRPEEVLEQRLHVTVSEVTETEIHLRLDGHARLATHDAGSGARKGAPKIDQFDLRGEATVGRETARFTDFHLVAFSETGHYDEIHEKVMPLGVLFVLSPSGAPADLAPPSSYGIRYFEESPAPVR